MYARFLLPPVLLALLALSAPLPAWGQTDDEIYCSNRNGRLPADQVMAACDRLAAFTRQTDAWRAKAYAWRGIAHNRANNQAAALADFNSALELDDDNFDALMGRAALRNSAKDYAAALDDLNRAQRREPNFGSVYLLRSNVHLQLRHYPEAIADADFVRGGGMGFLNLRCWTRAVAGVELDKAQLACNQALWIQPDSLTVRDSRGLVALKQKRFQAAWNDFNEMTRRAPTNARGWYGRGLAAIALGREADGKADIAAATALTPDIAAIYAGQGVTVP
jgi:tetratricopeptide (TPR) repeat protein